MIENQMYNIKKIKNESILKLWIFHRGLRCAENQEESLQQKISLRLNDDSTFVPRICRLSRCSLIIIRVVVSFIRDTQPAIRRKEVLRRGPLDFIATDAICLFIVRVRSSVEHRVQPIFHPFSLVPHLLRFSSLLLGTGKRE